MFSKMKIGLVVTLVAVSILGFPHIAHAAVPTPDVCKSFASHAIKWNTEARKWGCTLPTTGANFHFREGEIFKWCMARPNEDRSPQALGHRDLLFKACPKYRKAS